MPQPERLQSPPAVSSNGSGTSPSNVSQDQSQPSAQEAEVSSPKYRWYHKVAGVAAAVFCFELGVFLLLFPWATQWDVSYGGFLPLWARPIWSSPYFRGAVSGIGLLDIYISFVEVFRLRRFSG